MMDVRLESVISMLFGRLRSQRAFRAPRAVQKIVRRLTLGPLVRVCPGKRHAWFESSAGLVRKPYRPEVVS